MSTTLSTTFIGHDWIGRVIGGRFTLLRWLGGTEKSSVFLTELDRDPGDPVQKAVIKLIPADEVDASACLAQWERARTLAHPHLMRLLGWGRCAIAGEDLLYVVTEYADEILSEILRERPLSPAEVAEMLDPVLEALSFLHSRNLVHGPLKPSNIMVVHDRLKLSIDGVHSAGEAGAVPIPRDVYVAPEVMAAGKVASAADLWSLGVLLVEALTQEAPQRNGSKGREPIVPATVPATFHGVVRTCLRVEPARRGTAADLRDSLRSARDAEAAEPSGRTRPARTRVVLAGMLLVAVGISAALVSAVHRGIWPPTPRPQTTRAATAPRFVPAAQVPVPGPSKASRTSASRPTVRPSPAAQPRPQSAGAPEPSATTAPAPSSGAIAQSQPSLPAPQAQPSPPTMQVQQASGTQGRGVVARGAAVYRAIPDIPQHISDGIVGHIRVRILVKVDSAGSVTDASIDTAGPSQYFAKRALQSAREWKFSPTQVRDRAVASSWALQFIFSQSGTTVIPTQTAP